MRVTEAKVAQAFFDLKRGMVQQLVEEAERFLPAGTRYEIRADIVHRGRLVDFSRSRAIVGTIGVAWYYSPRFPRELVWEPFMVEDEDQWEARFVPVLGCCQIARCVAGQR